MKLINNDAMVELDKLIAERERERERGDVVFITDVPYEKTQLAGDKFNIDVIDKALSVADVFITTCQEPLSTKIKYLFADKYKYSLIGKKSYGSANQAKYRPINNFEEVIILSNLPLSKMIYNPQMEIGKPYKGNAKRSGGTASGMIYKHDSPIENSGTRFPKSILDIKSERGFHPTQKPVALMENLIKTYSNEGDTIIDPFMGSGTTGVAAKNTNRKFIGIEKDEKYYNIAVNRIKGA